MIAMSLCAKSLMSNQKSLMKYVEGFHEVVHITFTHEKVSMRLSSDTHQYTEEETNMADLEMVILWSTWCHMKTIYC